MLQLINVGNKSLLDYGTIASRGLMEEIRRLAAQLEGKRVLHLSATAFGGGVAEILYALVPLMRDAGLDAEWRIIRGADEFFNVTKAISGTPDGGLHSYLRGRCPEPEQLDVWSESDRVNLRDRPLGAGRLVLLPGDSGGGASAPPKRPSHRESLWTE